MTPACARPFTATFVRSPRTSQRAPMPRPRSIIELYDPLVNNERVTARMVPVLERAADGDAALTERSGASEDVSFFLNEVPGLYFNLVIVPRDRYWTKAAPNHSPNFFIDERALVVGVRALAMVTVNDLAAGRGGVAGGRHSPRLWR